MSLMKQISQAIFLHRINYSDSSLIITCYTRDKGIRKYIFRGAKKKAQHLFAMAPLELTYSESAKSELNVLYETQLLFRPHFQESPVKSAIAFFMAEVLRKTLPDQQADEELFLFIMEKLQQLEQDIPLYYEALIFLCDLTKFLGITPLISGDSPVFDVREGIIGVYAAENSALINGPEVVLLKNLFSKQEVNNFDKGIRDKALNLLLSYYSVHIPSMKQVETLQVVRETLY